jgi:hypothetical protein
VRSSFLCSGRGKTFIARKIARYLTFFHGAPCEVFNCGEYRRKHFAAETKSGNQPADLFKHSSSSMLDQFARHAMEDLKVFLRSGHDMGRVAIFDATNTSRDRRQWTIDELMNDKLLPSLSHILFVESICDDEAILQCNYRAKSKLSPDYADQPEETAIADFKQRISYYQKVYQPMADDRDDDRLSYVKVVDGGRQLIVNNIKGFLPGRVVQFLMNLHTTVGTLFCACITATGAFV